jgi:hypothetical protein
MPKVILQNYEFSFTDDDVCNLDDAIYADDYNPHNKRLWLLHDHGFTICVVWANSLQDALDEAVDCNKMDRFLVTEEQTSDYDCKDIYNCESLTYLGNASEPFDIESLGYVEIAPPKFSLSALFGDKPIQALSAHLGC